MMRRLKYLLPLALFVPLLMAPSGGFPVNPIFQTTSIQAVTGVPAVATQSQVFTTGFPEQFFVAGSAPVDTRMWDQYVDSAGTMHYRTLTDNNATAANWIDVTRTLQNIGTITIGAGGGSIVLGAATGGGQGAGTLNTTGYFTNGTPSTVSFDANLVVSPTYIICNHCQGTPTVVRNSIGNYTLQPQSVGAYIWTCMERNNSSAGIVTMNSNGIGGFVLLGWSTAGSLADPGTVECIGNK